MEEVRIWHALNDKVDDLVLEHGVGMIVRDEERNVISLARSPL